MANLKTDKELLDFLHSFDAVYIEATHDIMEIPPKPIAVSSAHIGPDIRQALSDAIDKEKR